MTDPGVANYIAVSAGSVGVGLVGKIVWDWLKIGHNGIPGKDGTNGRNGRNGRNSNNGEFLTEKVHTILCDKMCEKFKNHVAGEITNLKDNYLDNKFNDLHNKINTLK
jgi:hypothetical protein